MSEGKQDDGRVLADQALVSDQAPSGLAASRFDPSREAIEAAIKKTDYKYFGDYELSDDQFEAVFLLVDCGRAFLRVKDTLARRSVPVMDPVWSAAFNAALDMVERAVHDSDQSPEGRDAQRLDAQHAGAGPSGHRPETPATPQIEP